jgi:hypothetical protein
LTAAGAAKERPAMEAVRYRVMRILELDR